ncbi:MAG: enoyl-CoA hydratase/isomerase family protein [Pseudomonadota bacterium]|nr:enoyl-CoA hydratase/isomerase family protein [Pseudomonadota bacterium]
MTEIICEVRNHIAFITLNRPAALNALSLDMVLTLSNITHECALDPNVRAVLLRGAGEKAFCAGGDIRALYQSYKTSGTVHREFFASEYALDYFLRFYPKPCIALMDGITMGGGMGIAQGSAMRIVGERTRIAMPEVAIGFFPDVGGSFFLSRLPGELGLYLALTGVQIRASDALYTGLADIYLAPEAVERLDAELAGLAWTADPRADVARVIDGLKSTPPGLVPLAAVRGAVDQHFAAASVAGILKSLRAERRPQYVDWARQTCSIIETRSPTMVAVTLQQLRRGRSMSFADCLRMEFDMTQQCFEQGDFIEGVRAMIIDKDNSPHWRPASSNEVTEQSVDGFFDGRWRMTAHPLANLQENF